MFASLSQRRVGIIGLGLMGGSLGMALRAGRFCRSVVGSARREDTRRQAVALRAVDEAFSDEAEAARSSDLIVLATPVRTIMRQVRQLGPIAPPGAVLIDLGSTKQEIVAVMADLPRHVQAIGGHPMCGKERAGIEAASADLYRGAVFCLTPLESTSAETLELAQELARAVGARPLVVEARRHDALVAAISHLPYVMAAMLTATAGEAAADDELTWRLAASGFRDASRLAGSDVDMMLDILLTNRQNVARLARRAAGRMDALAAAIEGSDEAALRAALADALRIWRAVYR